MFTPKKVKVVGQYKVQVISRGYCKDLSFVISQYVDGHPGFHTVASVLSSDADMLKPRSVARH